MTSRLTLPNVMITGGIYLASQAAKTVFFPDVNAEAREALISRIFSVVGVSLAALQRSAGEYSIRTRVIIGSLVDNLWITYFALSVLSPFSCPVLVPKNLNALVPMVCFFVASSCLLNMTRSVLTRIIPYEYSQYIAPTFNEIDV